MLFSGTCIVYMPLSSEDVYFNDNCKSFYMYLQVIKERNVPLTTLLQIINCSYPLCKITYECFASRIYRQGNSMCIHLPPCVRETSLAYC